jgi:SAM-dependent methyltransferase
VLTGPQFRSANWSAESKRAFFQLGEEHFARILRGCRRIDPAFHPKKALEFGCGVGRLLIPLAGVAEQVVGVDISSSMLKHAATHCQERGLRNVTLLPSDDSLSRVQGSFDLILSFIVFQHVPTRRGTVIFSKLLGLLNEGGIAAIHLPYARVGLSRFTQASCWRPVRSAIRSALPFLFRDPEMQMNCYSLTDLANLAQRCGIDDVRLELYAEGPYRFAFVFLRKGRSA